VQGQPVDGRSDQFSLAVIAYEMLTGDKPYTGEHLTTVVYKIVAEEPPLPHRLNPTVSGPIETTVRKALSKKADARYRNCQDFVDALEKACAATKGWKTMPRGGSLNEPTIAEVGRPAVTLPPARRARSGDTTATSQRAARRKSGFLPFLAAILMAAALLALIGYQASPWFTKNQAASPPEAEKTADQPPSKAAGKPAQPPLQSAAQSPAAPAASAPAPVRPPSAAVEQKPSPMPSARPEDTRQPAAPPEEKASPPVQAKVDRRPAPAVPREPAAPATQPVAVMSSPGGATATLDGRPDVACTTPCSLQAAPGLHRLAVTMPGHEVEHREISVGSSPLELPAIIMRPLGGTLMLTSSPSGAAVLVNGKRLPQLTPAQIPLTPGTYTVTVEKDGQQSSRTVEIRNGAMNYQKVILGQQ
jgi:serine/threonine-protein kinase